MQFCPPRNDSHPQEGDDQRQDALVMQVITAMDIWLKAAGLDLHFSFFCTVATGHDTGPVRWCIDGLYIAVRFSLM